MKQIKIILRATLILMLLASCKDSPASKSMKIITKQVTGNNADIDEKYAALLKELSAKTALSNDQLLEAFPKKLNNLSLDESEEKKVEPKIAGTQLVAGHFGDDTVRMEILDAAGEKAIGAIIPLKMLDLNTITSENNNTIKYTKKERNGIFTFGTDRDENTKADYQAKLRFLYDNRFYVTLEGKNMDTDALWDAIQLDDLKRFKKLNK